MAQDKHCVYYEGKATAVRDFAKLTSHPLKASRGIFYTEGANINTSELLKMPEGTDAGSLKRVNDYRDWYADKDRVYYQNRIIPNVAPWQIEIFTAYMKSEIVRTAGRLMIVHFINKMDYWKCYKVHSVDKMDYPSPAKVHLVSKTDFREL